MNIAVRAAVLASAASTRSIRGGRSSGSTCRAPAPRRPPVVPYHLNGRKRRIGLGSVADLVVVWARSTEDGLARTPGR